MLEPHSTAQGPVVGVLGALARCEAVIDAGLQTFIDVGRALSEIRDSRLYRETHGNFEAYCAERWSLSRPRAYQLIQSSEIAAAMSTSVDTPVPTERVARELAPLRSEPETLRIVWKLIVEDHGPHPTAMQARNWVTDLQAGREYIQINPRRPAS